MHTEAEAMTKQCRFGGRDKADRFAKCIASGCMGWRETAMVIPATYSPITGRKITEQQPARGFCGYAGRG